MIFMILDEGERIFMILDEGGDVYDIRCEGMIFMPVCYLQVCVCWTET